MGAVAARLDDFLTWTEENRAARTSTRCRDFRSLSIGLRQLWYGIVSRGRWSIQGSGPSGGQHRVGQRHVGRSVMDRGLGQQAEAPELANLCRVGAAHDNPL
jgi:hypothetical protein